MAVKDRPQAAPPSILTAGPVVVDTERYTVDVKKRPVVLTRKEFALLSALMRADGRVLSREVLMGHGWPEDVVVDLRTVDQHVTRLRKKIGPGVVETVAGIGYRTPRLR